MNVCAALLVPSTRTTINSGFNSTRFCGPPARQIPRPPFPFRSWNINQRYQPTNLDRSLKLSSSFQPHLSVCPCSIPLSLPSFLSSSSYSLLFPYKLQRAMTFLTALLLSLVFLASLANILSRLHPKKLQALLRTLFPEAPIPPPASSKAAVPLQPPPPRRQEERRPMSVERRAELRRVFATFDRNGDGLITREELRESLRGLRISVSDEEVEEAVAGSDANGDGRIDLDEFCGLLESMSAVGKAVGGGEEAELREAFDVFDRDGDGVITVEELGRVLSSLGMSEGKRAEACQEMIRKVDVDGDGMVNFDEFKKMMRGGQTLLVSAY